MSSKIEELRKYTKNLSILFVDDAEDIRDMYHFFFDDLFNKVYEASDGDEALGIYKQNQEKIDLILTDQSMPNMNGIDMIREVRKIDSKIPVVLVTATKEQNDLIDAINLNVTSFIEKPIQYEKIIDSIESSIQKVIVEQLRQQNQDQELELLRYKNSYTDTQQDDAFKKQLNIIKNHLYKRRIDVDENTYILIDHYYKPKDILSGDAYSIHTFNQNNNIFFFIIDAMGKGISASVSSFVSTSFINYYFDKTKDDFSLRDLIQTYIDFIRFELLEDEIISATFGLFNTSSNVLALSNFSMPAVIGLDTQGNVKRLSKANLPITTYLDDFHIDVIDMSNISKFMLYSDGLTENMTTDEVQYQNYIQEDFKNSSSKDGFLKLFNSKVQEQEDDSTLLYFEKLSLENYRLKSFTYDTLLTEVDRALEDFSEIILEFDVGMVRTMKLESGFTEMIMNAYEHGNLGIGSNQKQKLMESGEYTDFLKSNELNHKDKNIMIQYYMVNEMLVLNIQDCGVGFDTNILKALLVKDTDVFHGRGVAMSSNDFDFIMYNKIGNSVLFGIKLK